MRRMTGFLAALVLACSAGLGQPQPPTGSASPRSAYAHPDSQTRRAVQHLWTGGDGLRLRYGFNNGVQDMLTRSAPQLTSRGRRFIDGGDYVAAEMQFSSFYTDHFHALTRHAYDKESPYTMADDAAVGEFLARILRQEEEIVRAFDECWDVLRDMIPLALEGEALRASDHDGADRIRERIAPLTARLAEKAARVEALAKERFTPPVPGQKPAVPAPAPKPEVVKTQVRIYMLSGNQWRPVRALAMGVPLFAEVEFEKAPGSPPPLRLRALGRSLELALEPESERVFRSEQFILMPGADDGLPPPPPGAIR
jgi:hypothetical protein